MDKTNSLVKINIGCGSTPIEGWFNYDNSFSIRLSKQPILYNILSSVGFISKAQREYINFLKHSSVFFANATKYIPHADKSVDVIYSCHMLEHLTKNDAINFLKESRRVLKNNGIIRTVIPDIKYLVNNYMKSKDADTFIENTLLTEEYPTLKSKIKYLFLGSRNHQWMYDENSLSKLLTSAGFNNPQIMKHGHTNIKDHGNLDLSERATGSVCIEAFR